MSKLARSRLTGELQLAGNQSLVAEGHKAKTTHWLPGRTMRNLGNFKAKCSPLVQVRNDLQHARMTISI